MVKYILPGKVDNDEILKYYKSHKIDCFIHASEHEGLPVSIMEAESSGIPIIATNVGGIREMIDGNGFLLSTNPDSDEISDAIISCLSCSDEKKRSMSLRSKEIWSEKFDAGKNAKKFTDHIHSRFHNKIKKVVLITEGYPFTDNEKSFIESELKELLNSFEITIIARIPFDSKTIVKDNLEKNLGSLTDVQRENLKDIIAYSHKWSKLDCLLSGFRYFFDSKTLEERRCIISSGNRIMIRFWESIKYYGKSVKFQSWIENYCSNSKDYSENTLYYTYWNLEPTLGLCLDRKGLNVKYLITRAHGYDYQDEQWEKSKRKPFMKTVDSLIDEIVFVSKSGKDYHIKKNGFKDDSKYFVSYIGSNKAKKENQSDIAMKNDDTTNYRVVSCSSLIPLKRVNYIINALKKTDEKKKGSTIEWIHFGDGPLMGSILELAQRNFGNGYIDE